MIELTIYPDILERTVRRARERNIIIPTFREQRDPRRIPRAIAAKLKKTALWDINPLNLFRITWHNEPAEKGGAFGPVNTLEFPAALTGMEARIIGLVGKWFPTGAHKVGAAFGCLVPKLVTGQFDPTRQKAVWPSTGNYCRAGAFDSALLGCDSIAVLPEGMSRERFDWLASVAGEVIKTPGSESNVKEIFDKCRELRESGRDIVIFNQFEEFGNYLWHYEVTGPAALEALEQKMRPGDTYRGFVAASGSAGTLAAADFLKVRFPAAKTAAAEALQCPTLLYNGFGSHRIEGIGDKHVPWIHNVKTTDLVIGVDDEAAMSVVQLFNEPAGRRYLAGRGLGPDFIEKLAWLGISSAANLIAAVKFARYFELGEGDVLLTVLTDSMELYGSRLRELKAERGEFTETDATVAHSRYLLGASVDFVLELSYYDRRRIHNLKYYTWVEQQGKTSEEIEAQWYSPTYWTDIAGQAETIDSLIEEFNAKTNLLGR